ncbi:sigma-70 family RNA polymerase sigma factor [Trichocoleus desertorum GB2-A4]|uniref:Sigma-70 family RNA polymerase sigma factor n=1 Tax=Trichocoleus desertorum GB2-A4 TaxID=2933944 RepID=A0ABV0JHH3_9CYAN
MRESENFPHWLRSITINLFYDALRRRKRAPHVRSLDAPQPFYKREIAGESASLFPEPEGELAAGEVYQQLRQAILDLPPLFRTVIVRREIEDLPYEAIAQVTGVSLGTVKSRLAHARYHLQQQLQLYSDRDR